MGENKETIRNERAVYEQAIEGHRSRWWIWRSKRSAGAEVSACRRDAH